MEVEFVIARILGHHAHRKDPNYVMIDDWSRPGTLVDGCRFQPCTDTYQGEKIIARDNIQAVLSGGLWNAGVAGEKMTTYMYGYASRLEAAMRAKVSARFPDGVPADYLIDNPLPRS